MSFFINFLLTAPIVYFIFSWIAMELNPANWTEGGRAVMVIISCAIAAMLEVVRKLDK